MRIPNKFNGYSADNRRIYNDPASVVATISTMGEGIGVADALASAFPAFAETTAAAVAPTAMEMAGQGIMQGLGGAQAASPFTASVPEVAGSNAITTAGGSPFTTAGGSVPTTAGSAPSTTAGFGNVAPGDITAASDTSQFNIMNPTVEPVPGAANPPAAGTPFGNAPIEPPLMGPPAPTTVSSGGLKTGFDQAMRFLGDTAKSAYDAYKEAPMPLQMVGGLALNQLMQKKPESSGPAKYKGPVTNMSGFHASQPSPYLYGFADGGITGGAPVERMSRQNAVGANTGYPMANQQSFGYANYAAAPQNPVSQNMLDPEGDARTDAYTGEPKFASGGTTYEEDKEAAEEAAQRKYYAQLMNPEVKTTGVTHHTEGFGIIPRSRSQQLSSPNTAAQVEMAAMMKKYGIKSKLPKALDPQGGGMAVEEAANGGIMYGLGGYSDGGRLLRGPGDGVSDSIPAKIGNHQPARLADGEFVVPARIVSELGNGSTEAGARKLYAMMDRVQSGRKKSIGKNKVAVDSKAAKHLPA